MNSESDKPLPSNKYNQKKTVLNGLSNEELLKQLANSPCASRVIPEDQSLEEYLRTSDANAL